MRGKFFGEVDIADVIIHISALDRTLEPCTFFMSY